MYSTSEIIFILLYISLSKIMPYDKIVKRNIKILAAAI